MSAYVAELARLLDESPDRLVSFPVDRGLSDEDHAVALRALLDAVAVLGEHRNLRMATFVGDHEDFPEADRIYVVNEYDVTDDEAVGS